jgi:hypothetical protein
MAAADANKLTDVLGQTVELLGVITIGKRGVTETVMFAVPVQPAPELPITENVVFAVGVTTILVPIAPLLQVKVEAPFAVKVAGEPAHTGFGKALIVTIGSEFTVTVAVCEPAHPEAFVPETVNTEVAIGLTTSVAALFPLGNQVNVVKPVAVKVELPPIQIAEGDALMLTTGGGKTSTVTKAELVHDVALVPITV